MELTALKGVQDILPDEVHRWDFLEQLAQRLFPRYGYRRIIIPIIEESRLFTRSIGQETDIVEKEMYVFTDRGGRSIALRPEATASVVRAYLEHHFDQQGLVKFFYSGPMFRGEKPQAGRNRQFYQIGVEALGCAHPFLDAEVIACAVDFLSAAGLKNFRLLLNSVGDAEDKAAFAKILTRHLQDKRELLCASCRQRFERNILRTLDCKSPVCKKIISEAPQLSDVLSPESKQDFLQVQRALDRLNIGYTLMPTLVRGLDYYTKTVFEITHEQLGAQNTILAGGRYNNLIADLGGKPAGAMGFALGVERVLLALDAESVPIPVSPDTSVYAIGLGDNGSSKIFEIGQMLRRENIAVQIGFEPRSLKSHLRQADKLGCLFVIIIGDNELSGNTIILKNMRQGTQDVIGLETIVSELKQRIGSINEQS